ncbi:wax ester/triacylglycerol synthase family O-acyltransferase [Mangrovimicrobium sediminis]|uniref:diacylglycerol O-acyltransferase n=1 Tax=Mangrovimicrobium sediminis TaxID=2562682 RepID=A0A4Z0LUN1_9GAMM|nr:wax ester/triacylglycerol synthase family O-acyltransferase [Haliea sp. SAOS-164]TGD70990.1 wax ester/triacylglycerol synthase family O-acyltransferase [Haliea sp. SAOS-164]
MKRIGLIDDAFLRVESRREPLHIGSLTLYQPPKGAAADFTAKLAAHLRECIHPEPPFNRLLVERMGMHYWEEAEDFDLSNHFVHTALPKPGRIRELLALVSRVHCAHLDRAYPMWRMYLIEGLEDGRVAMYFKIHHALVDGVAGMRLMLKSMATTPEASVGMPAPWEVTTIKSNSRPLPVPNPFSGGISAVRTLAREGLHSALPVAREIADTVYDLFKKNGNLALAGQAPVSVFNEKVSATRRFAAQSYSTARMRAVAEAYGATLNDVVLAMCAGALRKYLQQMDRLPEISLNAAVPVSVRRHDDQAGNEVAFAITWLATDIDDPGERLRAIKAGMDYNKDRIQRLSSGQYMTYAAAMLLPGTFKTLLRLAPDKTLGNVIISHVPGPRRTMYWQGMRLCGIYPVSVIIDHGALNITVVSRDEAVDFGLIACRKTVPQMQRLLDYLEDALGDLEATVRRQGRARTRAASATGANAARKQAAGKTRAKAKKKAGARKKAAVKKAPARKAAAKKAVAKTAPVKKAPVKKAVAKKTPVKKASAARSRAANVTQAAKAGKAPARKRSAPRAARPKLAAPAS